MHRINYVREITLALTSSAELMGRATEKRLLLCYTYTLLGRCDAAPKVSELSLPLKAAIVHWIIIWGGTSKIFSLDKPSSVLF